MRVRLGIVGGGLISHVEHVPNSLSLPELFELAGHDPTAEWLSLRDRYEQALEHFEAMRFDDCTAALEGLAGNGDLPSTKLATRVAACREVAPEEFDAVLTLDSK